MGKQYQICKRCIMDTTDPEIIFDENGICNHCKNALKQLNKINNDKIENPNGLKEIVEEIKKQGKGKKYDCIIGVSGGVDSTYVAHLVKDLGLKPLAVHLDNGWDSELAVNNVIKILKQLDIDLYTHVIDWEEFKDLQMSFLKASVPDLEIPSDHAIQSILYIIAKKYNIKYIINGCNTTSESILPRYWSYGHTDWKYIKNLQKQFGNKKLKTFPHYSLKDMIYYKNIYKIKNITLLDYIDYSKEEAIEILKEKFNWEYYGGKHYESLYTKFIQAYILPTKFNYDKRRAHLSSLIAAGQMTREEALEKVNEPLYNDKALKEDIDYLISKFGITREQFDELMRLPNKQYWDYKSYQSSWYFSAAKKIYKFMKNKLKINIKAGW